MIPPTLHSISRKEFEKAEEIYKIISDKITNTHVCFELLGKTYYIGYPSSYIINVEMMILEKESYLLVGVDSQVVVLCLKSGRILFSLGLSSYFKYFEDTNDLSFTIFSELADYSINKYHLEVSKITYHELEF